MLILYPEDVHYCYVKYPKASLVETLPGLIYYEHLFIKVASYSSDQFQNALLQCRHFLEQKMPVLSIVVKEPTGATVWSENDLIKLIDPNEQPENPEISSRSEKAEKLVLKYRGVEIVSDSQTLQGLHFQEKLKLKYRGTAYTR
jgi:hypothetical protein